MVLAISYIIVPVIYNEYIIGLIEISNAKLKMNRIRSIDIYICVIFVLMTFGLISKGITNNSTISVVIGFFIGLFFIISFVIIQSKKITPEWLRSTFSEVEPALITSYYTNVSIAEDFFSFISDNFTILYSPFTNLILLIFIYSTCLSFLAFIGSFSEGGIMTTSNGHLYLLILSIYITIAIHTTISKPVK